MGQICPPSAGGELFEHADELVSDAEPPHATEHEQPHELEGTQREPALALVGPGRLVNDALADEDLTDALQVRPHVHGPVRGQAARVADELSIELDGQALTLRAEPDALAVVEQIELHPAGLACVDVIECRRL